MKFANDLVRVAMMVAALALGSCNNAPADPPLDLHPAAPPADMAARICVSTCATHAQCQSSCAAAPVGINCCDQATASCYVVANSICPEPPSDMTMSTAPY